jgi:hypothetical protein
MAAPGAGGGATFTDMQPFSAPINDAGMTVFISGLSGATEPDRNRGIWTNRNSGALELFVRAGDGAPGTSNAVFDSFQAPLINGPGKIAFLGTLRGDSVTAENDNGIWTDSGSVGLQLIAREGDHAAGLPPDVLYDRFPEDFILNGQGQLAFTGYLRGPGIGPNDQAIWAQDRAGNTQLIAYVGGTIQVGPADTRTIRSLQFIGGSGNQDGRRSGFNELGQLTFAAEFTNSSWGVFVADLTTVPEPTAAAIAWMLAFCVSFRRWPNRG